jgi:hypothetical protein
MHQQQSMLVHGHQTHTAYTQQQQMQASTACQSNSALTAAAENHHACRHMG